MRTSILYLNQTVGKLSHSCFGTYNVALTYFSLFTLKTDLIGLKWETVENRKDKHNIKCLRFVLAHKMLL